MQRDNLSAFLLAGVLASLAPKPEAHLNTPAPAAAETEQKATTGTGATRTIDALLIPAAWDFRGRLRYQDHPSQHRQDLKITVKVGLGHSITPEQARDAVLLAIFPDDSRCFLDFQFMTAKVAEYTLRLRQHRDTYSELHGRCEITQLPQLSAGGIEIRYAGGHGSAEVDRLVLSADLD